MDRSKVEEILKKYAEDYDVQSVSAENYIREHESDLRDRFLYAEYLEKPVNKKQIMFWNGNQCTYDGVPREVFEDTYRKKGKEYSYVWVIRNDEDIHPEAPLEITYVKKNTPEYWEALAVSGYLIGDGNLPVPYVKREEQFYANVYHKQEKTGIDTECLYEKELFKMDYLFQKPEEKEKDFRTEKKDIVFCELEGRA